MIYFTSSAAAHRPVSSRDELAFGGFPVYSTTSVHTPTFSSFVDIPSPANASSTTHRLAQAHYFLCFSLTPVCLWEKIGPATFWNLSRSIYLTIYSASSKQAGKHSSLGGCLALPRFSTHYDSRELFAERRLVSLFFWVEDGAGSFSLLFFTVGLLLNCADSYGYGYGYMDGHLCVFLLPGRNANARASERFICHLPFLLFLAEQSERCVYLFFF